MSSGLAALASGLFLSACSTIGIRTTAEPPYQVIDHAGPVEIRSYGLRLAAETVVQGTAEQARSTGFRRLAGFIFGKNRTRDSIAMTAPVAQAGAARIDMTAPVAQLPVAQSPDTPGSWRIRFFMPAEYTRQTVPQPTDPTVEIIELPPETVAVLRFSGIPWDASVKAAQASLLGALKGSAWHAAGEPFAWFYDPPWTIPPLRRNEAVVMVAK